VVQRVVELGEGVDPRLGAAVEQIQGEPTFLSIAVSPAVTLIVNRSDAATEAWMKTPRNRHQFEGVAARFTSRPRDVDYLVTINDRQLEGLPIPLSQAYGAWQIASSTPSPSSKLSSPTSLLTSPGAFTPKPILSSFEPINFPSIEPSFKPLSTELGLDTVLLHELGHVSQYMRENQEAVPEDADLVLHPPDMRDLESLAVERALSGKGLEVFLPSGGVISVGDGLDDPIWTHLRTLLNALRSWLHDAEGFLGDRPGTDDLRPQAQRLEELMAQAQLKLGLWIEYDVISNVEHPFALSKGEPIRTRHGEEAELGEQAKPKLLFDLSESLRGPRTLKDVRSEMVDRAQTFSMDLPSILAKISATYADYVKRALPILREIRE